MSNDLVLSILLRAVDSGASATISRVAIDAAMAQEKLKQATIGTAISEQKLEQQAIATAVAQERLEQSAIASAIAQERLEQSGIQSDIAEERLEQQNIATAISQERLEQQTLATAMSQEKLRMSTAQADLSEKKLQEQNMATAASMDETKAAGGLMSQGLVGGLLNVTMIAAMVIPAIVAIGKKCTSMAGDFQQAMLDNVAGAGLLQSKMGDVSKSVLQMAVQVGRSPTQLATALYPILSGFSAISEKAGKSSLSLLTLKLAFESVAGTTTNGSLVAKAAVQVYNSLGLATNNAAKNQQNMQMVMDMMNKTVEDGNMKWQDFQAVAGKLATSITGTTIKMSEAEAAEASLTNQAYSAQTAQSSLAMLFQKMDIQTSSLAKKASGLGISFDQTKFKSMNLAQQMAYLNQVTDGSNAKLLALFNGNGKVLRTFLALRSGAKGYASTLTDLQNAQGATAAKFATANEGMNQSMARVKAGLDAIMIAIGAKLLPVVTGFVNDAIMPAVTWFENLAAGTGGLSNIFGQLGINTQTLQQIWSLLGVGMAYVRGIFQSVANTLTGPVSGALKGANSSIGAFINGGLRWFRDTLAQVNGVLFALSSQAGPAVTDVLNGLKGPFKEVSGIIGGVFSSHMKTAAGLAKDLGKWFTSSLMPAIRQAMPGFESLGRTIITTVVPGLLKLWAIGQGLVDKVMPPLVHAFMAAEPVLIRISGIIAGGLALALRYLMPAAVQAGQAVANFAGDIASRVIPIITQFWNKISVGLDWLQTNWQYIWPSLSVFLKGIWDGISGIIRIAWALVSGIIKIGLDILTDNWGQAWTDLKDMLAGVWGGMKQVVQGYVEQIQGVVGGLVTGVLAKMGLLRNGTDQHTNDMQNKAALHTLQMKEKVVDQVIDMQKRGIQHTDEMITGVLNALKTAKTPAEKHALEMKLKVLVHTKQMQEKSLSQVETMKRGLEDKMKSLKDNVSKAWGGLSSNIQSIVGSVSKWLGDTWNKAVSTVVGWFTWLYNHNYYWKNMVDAITNVVKACVAWLQSAWANTVQWISDRWGQLAGFAKTAWQKVSSVFSGIWSNYIATPLANLWSSLSGWFTNLTGQSTGWGKNLIQGFINGINGMLVAVGNAVSGVAQKVAAFLGFHSPSKEGPGREAHLWGPNLVKMFANDIQSTAPKARKAAESMMSQLAATIKSYPDLISKAYMSGNKTQEKSLKQQLAMLKTQMSEYKGLIREDGYKYDQYNPNNPINFGKGKNTGSGYGTLSNPGGSSTSSVGSVGSSGGSGSGSGSGNTYIINYNIHPTIVVPQGTTKEQAQAIYDELDKKMARSQRMSGANVNNALGAAA